MASLALLCSILCLTTSGAVPTPPPQLAVEQMIASLVVELGDARYDVRERATDSLRRIGSPAISALEKAAESDDPEVAVRARDILADVRLGISPDWPAEMILLVRHYGRLNDDERRSALQRLVGALKEKAVLFVLSRVASANTGEASYACQTLTQSNDEKVASRVLDLLKEPRTDPERRLLDWARSRVAKPTAAPVR